MTGAGDLIQYHPGDSVGVEVTANTNGTVARRGQGVALTGENRHFTEVSLTATAGAGVGFLARDPGDYTGSQSDYSAGDAAGRAEIILNKPVVRASAADDWDPAASGTQTPAVGDLAEWTADGALQLYNSADAALPYGVVFSVQGQKIAVAVYR